MRCIALFGVPGTGKSTLMRRIMLQLGGPPPYKTFKQGTATGHLFSQGPSLVLGLYRDGDVYGGTDRLSMSCYGDVLACIAKWSLKWPFGNVLFEGDRLASRAFLHDVQRAGHTLWPYYLRAPRELRIARFAERGSQQAERFLVGRDTKVRNLAAEFPGPWMESTAPEHIERNAEQVLQDALQIKLPKGA